MEIILKLVYLQINVSTMPIFFLYEGFRSRSV